MIQFSAPTPARIPTPGSDIAATGSMAFLELAENDGFSSLLQRMGGEVFLEPGLEAGEDVDPATVPSSGIVGKLTGKTLPDGSVGATEDLGKSWPDEQPAPIPPALLPDLPLLAAPLLPPAPPPQVAAADVAQGNAPTAKTLPGRPAVLAPPTAISAPVTQPIPAATFDTDRLTFAPVALPLTTAPVEADIGPNTGADTRRAGRQDLLPVHAALTNRSPTPSGPAPQAPGNSAQEIATPASPDSPHRVTTTQMLAAPLASATATPPGDAPKPVLTGQDLPAASPPLHAQITAPLAAVPSQTTASPPAPQDFAALVDRLSEARDAVAPPVVRTALRHAQFGQVSLEFRHEDGGLAVTMASSAPGFGGSVQTAVAVALAQGASNGDVPRDGPQPSGQLQAGLQPDMRGSAERQASSGGGGGTGQPGSGREGRAQDRQGDPDLPSRAHTADHGPSDIYA